MRINESVQVDAALADVWRILALEYGDVSHWARAVTASKAISADAAADGAPVSGRTCEAAFGAVQERIMRFNSLEHELIYEASGKAIPFFITRLQGRWKLNANSAGTRVRLTFDTDIMAPFSAVLGWLVRRQFAVAIKDTLTDLKHFAETGEVHPQKAAAIA